MTEHDLIEKYRQERPGFAPWSFINTLSEDELKTDLRIALSLPGGVAGVIGGWLAQALRMRPAVLHIPAGW